MINKYSLKNEHSLYRQEFNLCMIKIRIIVYLRKAEILSFSIAFAIEHEQCKFEEAITFH